MNGRTEMLAARARRLGAATLGALTLIGCVAFATTNAATAYSPQVQRACRADYNRFCPGYPLYSATLRQCMEAKAQQLSPVCVSALIDSGEVERSRLSKR